MRADFRYRSPDCCRPRQIEAALATGHTIDITTTGRTTGEARRIEIVFHNIDGRLIITGSPRADRKRAWIYNLEADPNLTFHLKGPVKADLALALRRILSCHDRDSTMEDVTIAEAKEKLEELISRAAHGEDVRISDQRFGSVRLQPIEPVEHPASAAGPQRRPGRWKGRFTVPARLFEPLSEEELRWLSGEASP